MLDLLLLFIPFFALVLTGWAATWRGVVPLAGIPALNSFVLYFGLSAMVFRLSASGALMQDGLLGLLLVYGIGGAAITVLALIWSVRAGLVRRDGGLTALVAAFPNTGFLGLPLLTGLLGPQAAGPVAATLIIDVLLLSSVCLAWAHSHGARDAAREDPLEAWHAAQASLKGALRNPLLWSMATGLAFDAMQWHLPRPVDETVRLLGLAATPTALFTLGAILARAQMQRGQPGASHGVMVPVALKLVVHPMLVCALGWGLARAGFALPAAGLLTLTLAAALPSASNVSMLAEREGADTALVARVILWTTAGALFSVALWAHLLGVAAHIA
ncbi:MAG: AEC family transporter [Aquabacterium sp.]